MNDEYTLRKQFLLWMCDISDTCIDRALKLYDDHYFENSYTLTVLLLFTEELALLDNVDLSTVNENNTVHGHLVELSHFYRRMVRACLVDPKYPFIRRSCTCMTCSKCQSYQIRLNDYEADIMASISINAL